MIATLLSGLFLIFKIGTFLIVVFCIYFVGFIAGVNYQIRHQETDEFNTKDFKKGFNIGYMKGRQNLIEHIFDH